MTRHEHPQATTRRVLAIYLATSEPGEPLEHRDGTFTETVSVVCKQKCLHCGEVFLARLPFLAPLG